MKAALIFGLLSISLTAFADNAVNDNYFLCELNDEPVAAAIVKVGTEQTLNAKKNSSEIIGKLNGDGKYIVISVTDLDSQLRVSTAGVQHGMGSSLHVDLDQQNGGNIVRGSCEVVTADFINKSSSSFYQKAKRLAEQK